MIDGVEEERELDVELERSMIFDNSMNYEPNESHIRAIGERFEADKFRNLNLPMTFEISKE